MNRSPRSVPYQGGPAGLIVTPEQIRVLEAVLRRSMPAGTTRSADAITHRKLRRSFHRWIVTYGQNLIDSGTQTP